MTDGGRKPRGLVHIEDLAPRKDPKGGAAKPVFGERLERPPNAGAAGRKADEARSPKKEKSR